MKTIKAVRPYIYPGQLNFKDKAFEAWGRVGGATVKGHYPRFLHKLMFSVDMPTLYHGETRLCFVQPVSLYFDTWFAGIGHEIVPFIWDAWPMYDDMLVRWMKRHKVRCAIFTSSQARERIQKRLPELNTMYCPEGIDTENYQEGKQLKDRKIDLLEFGRGAGDIFGEMPEAANFSHVKTMVDGKYIFDDNELKSAMGDAKMTICLPRSITHPQDAEGQETLTQRYWECMLSRIVMLGHAPKELVDLIGYNPVIEIKTLRIEEVRNMIADIIEHIGNYQELVDRNRETALKLGYWTHRIKTIREWLNGSGYV